MSDAPKLIDIANGILAIGPRRQGRCLDRELMAHIEAQSADVNGKPERQRQNRHGKDKPKARLTR